MLGVGRGGPLAGAFSASPDGPATSAGRLSGPTPAIVAGPGVPAPGASETMPLPGEKGRPPAVRAFSERDAWTALAAVEGLGPVTFSTLVGAFGTARRVLSVASAPRGRARLVEAAAAEGLRLSDEVAAAAGRARDEWPGLRARLVETRVIAITAEEGSYPPRLRAIELPPPVLFVRGDVDVLSAPRLVSVVGTRRPTEDGRRTAARLSGALAAAGAVVVSGLAVGIDGAAHASALAAGGRSVAVMGSGHGRLYPPVHAPLAAEIVATGGAVVAELPPDAPPTPGGFPRRNRIIAGLAEATVIVEAGERSGALVTASWALEQGRPVFAVPGPVDRPQSIGCNRLLRTAAGEVRIVAGADELLEDLGYGVPLPVRARKRTRSESATAEAGAIVARLGSAEASAVNALLAGPATADRISGAADLAPATVLAVLTRLEADGLVRAYLGRYQLAGALENLRPARADGQPGEAGP